ncbi:MAG: HNH endonuclease [Planctomycetaceae bacterium]
MDTELEKLVWSRANAACEYCRLPQDACSWTFHIEHIIAQQHGGLTVAGNLALSCPRCNLFKGTNLASVDHVTGRRVWLFHPRRHLWQTHFRWSDLFVVGRTPAGRATVALLHMNAGEDLETRQELREMGRFPPHANVRLKR